MNTTQSAIDLEDADGLVAADHAGLLRAASTSGACNPAGAHRVVAGKTNPENVCWATSVTTLPADRGKVYGI